MGWWGSGAQNQPWVATDHGATLIESRRSRRSAAAAAPAPSRRRRRCATSGADGRAGLEDAARRGGGLGGGVARGVLQLEVEAALALGLVAHAAQLLGALLGGDGDGGGGARRRGAGVERLALAAELGERLGVAVGRGEAAPDELDRRVPLGAVEVRREVLVRQVGGVLLVDERRDAVERLETSASETTPWWNR